MEFQTATPPETDSATSVPSGIEATVVPIQSTTEYTDTSKSLETTTTTNQIVVPHSSSSTTESHSQQHSYSQTITTLQSPRNQTSTNISPWTLPYLNNPKSYKPASQYNRNDPLADKYWRFYPNPFDKTSIFITFPASDLWTVIYDERKYLGYFSPFRRFPLVANACSIFTVPNSLRSYLPETAWPPETLVEALPQVLVASFLYDAKKISQKPKKHGITDPNAYLTELTNKCSEFLDSFGPEPSTDGHLLRAGKLHQQNESLRGLALKYHSAYNLPVRTDLLPQERVAFHIWFREMVKGLRDIQLWPYPSTEFRVPGFKNVRSLVGYLHQLINNDNFYLSWIASQYFRIVTTNADHGSMNSFRQLKATEGKPCVFATKDSNFGIGMVLDFDTDNGSSFRELPGRENLHHPFNTVATFDYNCFALREITRGADRPNQFRFLTQIDRKPEDRDKRYGDNLIGRALTLFRNSYNVQGDLSQDDIEFLTQFVGGDPKNLSSLYDWSRNHYEHEPISPRSMTIDSPHSEPSECDMHDMRPAIQNLRVRQWIQEQLGHSHSFDTTTAPFVPEIPTARAQPTSIGRYLVVNDSTYMHVEALESTAVPTKTVLPLIVFLNGVPYSRQAYSQISTLQHT